MIPRRRKRGFGAVVAVLSISLGALAASLVATSAAISYSNAVYRRESRTQAILNAQSCIDSAPLLLAKDPFLPSLISLPEFGCELSIDNVSAGNINAHAAAVLNGVKATVYGRVPYYQ